MNVVELRRTLKETSSFGAWVSAVSQFFESYKLFYGHGTDNAQDEAYWLIKSLNGWESDGFSLPKLDKVIDIAEKRANIRKPLAYLLNEAWFAGLPFYVDERVLIPRSPLAELLESQFSPWTSLDEKNRVLEIGTGSACIAVAIAHHCPGVLIDATDISVEALKVAEVNTRGWEEQITLIQSDLFSAVEGTYKIIISNPPYVPHDSLENLPPEYKYEPSLGFDGGNDGLNIINRLLQSAAKYLTPDGLLFLEVGESQPFFDLSHNSLPVTWLSFERGGDGVAVLTRDDLTGYLED